MKLTIKRFAENGEATVGRLYIDGKRFCYTLEDQYQPTKVAGETRIPPGIYPCKLTYSPKFTPRLHHLMVEIASIPGFSFVYFHPGNDDDDTSGCVLLGDWRPPDFWTLSDSLSTYQKFYALVEPVLEKGGDLTVEVIDAQQPLDLSLPKPDPNPPMDVKPVDVVDKVPLPDVSTTLWEDIAFKIREWLRGRTEIFPQLPSKGWLVMALTLVTAIGALLVYFRSC